MNYTNLLLFFPASSTYLLTYSLDLWFVKHAFKIVILYHGFDISRWFEFSSMLDIVEYGLFDLHLNYFDIHFYHIARYNTYNRRYILHEKLNVGIVQVIQIGTK